MGLWSKIGGLKAKNSCQHLNTWKFCIFEGSPVQTKSRIVEYIVSYLVYLSLQIPNPEWFYQQNNSSKRLEDLTSKMGEESM